MSNPILIDPLKFAREGREMTGKMPVSALDERVHSDLSDTSGTVEYTVEGFRDGSSRLSLRLRVNADVMVSCQRCLEAMPYQVATDVVVTLFARQEKLDEAVELDETLDAILALEELDVVAMIEDEIIMGLPHSTKHDECGSEALTRAKADKPNPFAVLATLKISKS
jgi:uncharacterized protein